MELSGNRKQRILCLHGFRTSGIILQRQMAGLRCHVNADYQYVNAPFPATGCPDKGIQQYYPEHEYFEWYSLMEGPDKNHQIAQSISFVLKELSANGPFDGILGFSQGCAMAMRICLLLQRSKQLQEEIGLKYVLFFGGVAPDDVDKGDDFEPLSLPSLHVMGDSDFVLRRSIALRDEWCSSNSTHTLTFDGGHHIPPLRAGIYPAISAWLCAQSKEAAVCYGEARPEER